MWRCFLVWGTTTKTNLNKLLLLQKKSARVITNSPFDAPSQPLFDKLNMLPLCKLYNFSLVCKYKNDIVSNYKFFNSLSNLTETESTYNIRYRDPWNVPYCRTDTSKTMLKYKLPSLLNQLSKNDIDIFSLNRKLLKQAFCSL